MKKIVIPTILAATILVAGAFAMMPVQKASTVHSALQSSGLVLTAAGVTPGTAATDTATWTIGQPFVVVAILASNTVDAGLNNNLAASVIASNLASTAVITEPNPAAAVALGDIRAVLDRAVADSNLVGSTTLAVTLADEGATHAATDAWTITVIIETRGSVAAPAAVLS